jgi:asparagine synthase (glutamine-hydrolysing)
MVCLWDGRIDNAGDLLKLAGLPPDSADPAIILNLYQRRGVEGLRDAVGDWSVCIWDANSRAIVLACDYAGIRPLYYYRGPRSLYWSSSLDDLARWTGIHELDDTYAAAFLSRGNSYTLTPYKGILAVPAGCAVFITADNVQRRPFWSLPIDREIRYRDEGTYEEHLRHLFRESVQARLARDTPTCSELSGGLDSSSVVCMAHRLRSESRGGASDLITLSYTHENSADEKFFREVERACGVAGCHLPVDDYPAAAADQAGALPGLWEPRFRKLARLMAGMGTSVLLTGQLGDFTMGNAADDSGQVSEWLARGRPGKAIRTAYDWGRAMQAPIYPILWRGIREAFFSWDPSIDPRAAAGAMPASREDSLTQSVRARFASYEQEEFAGDPAHHAPPGRRLRFRSAADVLHSRRLQTPEPLQHLAYSHPYAHRSLLEFMLTIPSHVAFGPGQPRRLMRRAFAGLLPPMILARKSKAGYASVFRAPLVPMARLMLQRPAEIQLVERGYLHPQSLISRLEKFMQSLDCNEAQLRQIIVLEFWLRNRMAPRTAPLPSAPGDAPSWLMPHSF